MTVSTPRSRPHRQPMTRRTFVRTAAGLAGILATGRPPATWAAREISLLTAVNYAPTSDVKLAELGRRFTKATGVGVRTDHIQSLQMPAKLSAELMSKAGHDIVSLEMHYPWLFAPGLVDVSDIANDLASKHGDWYAFAKEHAYVKGQWLGIPYLYLSFPGSHRIDFFEQVGEKVRRGEQAGLRPSPAEPAGRHTVGVPRSLGIWKASKNVDAAREFLRWFFEPAQYHEWIMSGDNYNHPVWRHMESHAVWSLDPKYKPLKALAQYSHLYGWPAPPDERIQMITNSYIIPNMFAKAVTNAASPKDAILWAETEIRRVLQT